jgi:hypothetical protein
MDDLEKSQDPSRGKLYTFPLQQKNLDAEGSRLQPSGEQPLSVVHDFLIHLKRRAKQTGELGTEADREGKLRIHRQQLWADVKKSLDALEGELRQSDVQQTPRLSKDIDVARKGIEHFRTVTFLSEEQKKELEIRAVALEALIRQVQEK